MMEDVPETTSTQDSWAEIAEAVREQLRKRIELMPAMTVAEQETFVKTVKDAMFMEEYAQCFDRERELRHDRVSFNS